MSWFKYLLRSLFDPNYAGTIIDDKGEPLRAIMRQPRCPNCGSLELYIGPSGGVITTVICGNYDCRTRFNIIELPTGFDIDSAFTRILTKEEFCRMTGFVAPDRVV